MHRPVRHDVTLLGDDDLYLFNEGTHSAPLREAGRPPGRGRRRQRTWFAVWAPNAERGHGHRRLQRLGPGAAPAGAARPSGIWEGFVPGVGARRPLQVPHRLALPRLPRRQGRPVRASAPRRRPRTALGGLGPRLRLGRRRVDGRARARSNALDAPMSIYEVHLGSWLRVPEDGNRSLTYRELAPRLAEYMPRTGLHPRRAAAGDGAPLLRLVGLPDRPATSRRPPATARRRTSCTSSTTCTSAGSA